jgi:multiple sugar transport system permease protein
MVRRRTTELTNLQFALLLALPVLVFLVLVVAYPLGYAFWMSLHQIVFFGGYRASYIGLQHYADILASREFWHSLWISVRFTVTSVVLTLAIGLGLALVLNRDMRFKGLVRALIILPWAVSLYGTGIMFAYAARGQTGVGTALAYFLGYGQPVNFINQHWVIEVLAVAHAWNLAPLVAFFVLASLQTIPRRLYHLADIDQLSRFEKFLHVTLPPIRFTLFVFTCIATVLSLKLFDLLFVLSGGGPGRASATLTYEIYKISFQNLNLGYGAAMSFYLLVLIVGSTLLLFFLWGRREARDI